jgi:hypothetical protein
MKARVLIYSGLLVTSTWLLYYKYTFWQRGFMTGDWVRDLTRICLLVCLTLNLWEVRNIQQWPHWLKSVWALSLLSYAGAWFFKIARLT